MQKIFDPSLSLGPKGIEAEQRSVRVPADHTVILDELHRLGDGLPAYLAELHRLHPGRYRAALLALTSVVGAHGAMQLARQIEGMAQPGPGVESRRTSVPTGPSSRVLAAQIGAAPEPRVEVAFLARLRRSLLGYDALAAEGQRRRSLVPDYGNGAALDPTLRHAAEASLGVSLAEVRVFEGPRAQQHAARVDAAAFAEGSNIVLGSNVRNAPGEVLAHEVAHVVQQRYLWRGAPATRVGAANSGAEGEASRVAPAIVEGRRARVSPAATRAIHRTPKGDPSVRKAEDERAQLGSMGARSVEDLERLVRTEKGVTRYALTGSRYEPADPGEVTLEQFLAAKSELAERGQRDSGVVKADGGAYRVQGELYRPKDAARDGAEPDEAQGEREAAPDLGTGDGEIIQRKATGAAGGTNLRASVQRGLGGGSKALPHLSRIQQSFGRYDVSGVQAHVGGAAATAAREIGASAFATGNSVAFAQSPDLHTAAHEAAHVVQQRLGVIVPGGVGRSGDVFEKHADTVADTVVRGESAEGLPRSRSGRANSRQF